MWTITRLKNLSGVYVECYRFSIFVVTDSVYYKYQYSKTYTPTSGFNNFSSSNYSLNRCLFKPFHLLSHTHKPTYKSESVYTNHCIMFPLHLVFNLLLKILHDLLWLIIFPIRNHKIKDHIRMCWPFDHSKVMN